MGKELKVIAYVKGLGEVVETAADFYSELKELKLGGARLISPRDEAYARLQTIGKDNIGEDDGTRTRAGFDYAKEQLPILRLNSRLLNPALAKKAVKSNRANAYFHTETTEEYEQSLKQAEKDMSKEPSKRSAVVLPSRDNFTMSDKENWEVLEAVLKDQAEPYFKFNGPITVYPVDKKVVDAQDGTIETVLWFRNLRNWSDFSGISWDLGNAYRARGVRESAEGTAKISKQSINSYTSKQAQKYLKILDGVRKGNLPASRLEEIVKYFNR